MNKLELIDGLIEEINALKFGEETNLDAIRRRTEMIIRNLFGNDSKYLDDLRHISFYPSMINAPRLLEMQRWQSGTHELSNMLSTMKEEVLLFDKTTGSIGLSESPDIPQSNRVFIVHGHDDAMKQAVARVIEKLGLDGIILHEKPNQGMTIIEKFTEYSNVSFSIVLLSPDDTCIRSDKSTDKPIFRARQNVIFELGFFIGKLGRERVLALYRQDEDFEMPSDYSGVLFIPFDASGRWQFDLIRELKACGYSVDANRILE